MTRTSTEQTEQAEQTEEAANAGGTTTDVLVIGGGTGGYSTALRAAALGLRVVLAERDAVGGTCLHRGCIPSKAMLHAAELVDGIAEARERWGVKATLDAVDWPSLVATRDDIVARNHRGVEGQLTRAGVTVVRGSAELTGPRSARISGYGEVVARRGVVLATGSRPRMLPGGAADGRRVVTSDDALYAPGLPGSVLVVGGGAIGVEYASLHRSLGADVTLVEAADRLVPLEDAEVSRHLLRGLKKRGIRVEAGARLLEWEVVDEGVRAVVRTARGESVAVA
ncbi:FAD-dependent oxidoreductase, partial [Streptomyces sp. HCCB10043]